MLFPNNPKSCHVNVVATFTVSIFIFLYWSLVNGPERTQYTTIDPWKNPVNKSKVHEFINMCYICTPDAAWRIFSFDIMREFPNITSLPILLPGPTLYQLPQCNRTASTASKLLTIFSHPNVHLFSTHNDTEFYPTFIPKHITRNEIFPPSKRLECSVPDINVHQHISAHIWNIMCRPVLVPNSLINRSIYTKNIYKDQHTVSKNSETSTASRILSFRQQPQTLVDLLILLRPNILDKRLYPCAMLHTICLVSILDS